MIDEVLCYKTFPGGNTLHAVPFVFLRDGRGKSATLIALLNVLERLKTQSRVDIFRTVKDLKDNQPKMVDNPVMPQRLHSR